MSNTRSTRIIDTVIDKYFRKYFEMDGVTEVCYNGKNILHVLDNTGWNEYETELKYDSALGLSQSIAAYTSSEFDEGRPLLGGYLPSEERVQFVMPPATAPGIISLSIRVPSKTHIPYSKFVDQGIFDGLTDSANAISMNDKNLNDLYLNKNYEAFIKMAVEMKKTIVISGATGSGKTTFMKSLIDFIPKDERLISIEDVDEIKFHNHKNAVKLYYPQEAKSNDFLNSATLLKSCLRMKPDRILLAELRGGETFDFINVISSGHAGSITSCHAGNVEETFTRLALMVLRNPEGQKIPYEIIEQMLKELIDVVVHMKFDHGTGKRYITDVYYKGTVL